MATLSSEVPARRRIQQACDQCRKRKIKCDGQSTCKTCLNTELQCSYGHQIKQGFGPKYIAHLEHKLRALENQVQSAVASPNSGDDGGLPQPSYSSLSVPAHTQVGPANSFYDRGCVEAIGPSSLDKPTNNVVESIACTSEYESCNDNNSALGYRGKSTGIEILRNLHRLCSSFVGFTLDQDTSAIKMANALDSALPAYSLHSLAEAFFLSEAQVHRWVDIAFAEAFTLWPFIDRQNFNSHLQRLLEQKHIVRDRKDSDYLGLVHMVLALGQRYDPDLINVEGDTCKSIEVRGIKHFAAAQDLVPLTECSRSITAVQTVLCMCLYMKSVSAQRMVHAYVSVAGYAAYQLGLHKATSAPHLPRGERTLHQRVYDTLRTFDVHVTCSLGLPRNLRAIEPVRDPIDTPSIACHEILSAANANMELMEILGGAVERVYFTAPATGSEGSTAVQYDQLCEVSRKLEKWTQKYLASVQVSNNSLSTCTKSQLFLKYSRCFVLLILYCPFIHHVAKPWQSQSPNASACGSECIEAAVQAIQAADALHVRGMLNEAYPLTIDVLVMAATALLVVELGAPEDGIADAVRRTSRNAKTLLEGLAKQNSTAAQCVKSLMPFYQSVAQSASTTIAPIEETMQDFTLFAQENNEITVFNSHLDPFNLNLYTANPPDEYVQALGHPSIWADWRPADYAAPTLAQSLWK